MIDRLDQIFVLLKHWILGFLPGGWQTPVGVILSVVMYCLRCILALFALTMVLERKGLGRMQNRHRAESRGTVWDSAADCGRHQVADQGRYCSAQRGCGWCIFLRR